MNLYNPLNVIIGNFDPNFILLEEARFSKVVMSCYTCFATSKSQPSKKVEKHNTQPFTSFEIFDFNKFSRYESKKEFYYTF